MNPRLAIVLVWSTTILSCSAVVDPDTSRLGGGETRADASVTIAGDAGAGADDAAVMAADGGGTSPCGPGLLECGASCVDVSRDPSHCGGCGRTCAATDQCVSGECACDPSRSDCGAVVGIGDPNDCGPTHAICATDEVCVDGACRCRPPLTIVAGRCTDLRTDPDHCGAPGDSCAGACASGGCVRWCPGGTENCGGACVDLSHDPRNCGACGDACARDQVCVSGTCREYRSPRDCAMCPCSACEGDFARCCAYPMLELPICVDADACP